MNATTQSRPIKRTKATRVRFDGDNSDHWYAIPTKGQLFALAIAAFNGASFPGSEVFTRDTAKTIIDDCKENGFLDKK